MEEPLHTLKLLNDAQHSLDPDYIKDVMEGLTKITGTYLHNLHQKQTNEESLKKMIDACPASLSYKCDKGFLPIKTAAKYMKSVQYIPMLAREGVRHNVGGPDGRGGLILRPKGFWNALQMSAARACTNMITEEAYLNV